MRAHWLFALIGGMVLTGPSDESAAPVPGNSVFRLEVLNESGIREGTGVVIHREPRGKQTFVVVVTSARLFERETGRRARLFADADGNLPVDIDPQVITTPYANARDLAVLKATVRNGSISALPVSFDIVPAGTSFVISGLTANGRGMLLAQQVRFCATRMVLGNAATAGLSGCQGAPAIVDGRVFGVVSECGRDRVPEITPLSVSRNFLLRTVPELAYGSNPQPKQR